MCYNCGCGLPDDDMGHPEAAITTSTFKKAAEAFGMTEQEAKHETLKLLQKLTSETDKK
jgi:hypothetical protein